MTTATTPPDPTAKAALQTEAAELEQDIKEAQTEATAQRVAGNDERADKLEASISSVKADLAEIKAALKGMTERPFAPAPGDGEAPPPAEAPPAEEAAPPADEKPKKRHWAFGDRWNEE